VLVDVFEGEVVVARAGTLGAEVGLDVPEQPAKRTIRADAVTKPTRCRFTTRNYPGPDNK
jgi:hypothetical protein